MIPSATTSLKLTGLAVITAALVACGRAAEAPTPAVSEVAPSATPAAPTPAKFTASHADYQCDKGKTLQMAYLNMEDGNSFAAMQWDGKTVLMSQVITASGAAYEPIDTSLALQWHTQGDVGTLFQKAVDKPDQLTALLKECQEVN